MDIASDSHIDLDNREMPVLLSSIIPIDPLTNMSNPRIFLRSPLRPSLKEVSETKPYLVLQSIKSPTKGIKSPVKILPKTLKLTYDSVEIMETCNS
jgi:hypothetical protein